MGNSLYPKDMPQLDSCKLSILKSIKLKELHSKKSKVRNVCFSNQFNYLYISFKGSRKVIKYDISLDQVDFIFKKHTTSVQKMFLDRSQTKLYTCDKNKIYVYDCRKNKLRNILYDYTDGCLISCFMPLNDRYLAVSLSSHKVFDIYDLRTEIKESLIYNKNSIQLNYSFVAFHTTANSKLLYVLDHEYLYVFKLAKLKEINRRFHGGKETQILHSTKDNKYLFTLNKGYITALKTKSLDKVASLKFKQFENSQSLKIMSNDRILIVQESISAIRVVDMVNFETVYILKQEDIGRFFVTSQEKHLVLTNDRTIVVYGLDFRFEGEGREPSPHYENLLEFSTVKKKVNFSESYKKIDYLVRKNEINNALIECRKIIRKNEKEHRAYFLTGKLLLAKFHFENAVEFFNQAILLSKQEVSDYFVWRGKAFFYMEMYREAVESLNKALILDPEKKSAKKNLKLAREKLKELEGSMVIDKNLSYPAVSNLSKIVSNRDFDYENRFVKAFKIDFTSEKSYSQNLSFKARQSPHKSFNASEIISNKSISSKKTISIKNSVKSRNKLVDTSFKKKENPLKLGSDKRDRMNSYANFIHSSDEEKPKSEQREQLVEHFAEMEDEKEDTRTSNQFLEKSNENHSFVFDNEPERRETTFVPVKESDNFQKVLPITD